MTIDDIEYIEKKVFFRIYTDNLDVIYSEVLDTEASLSEEVSQITTLEGMASIEGYSLSMLKDSSIVNSFRKITIQIEATKNKIFPIDLENSEGSLYYYDDYVSMSEPAIKVYVSIDTLNSIINEFKNDNAKMEIGIYANLFVPKTMSEYESDDMLEKLFVVNKSNKAILANFAIRRQTQKLDLEDENTKQDSDAKIENKELIDETKKVQDLLGSQNIINRNILNNISILKWIFIGWSALFLFTIFNK
jgi:hypothetical protein